MRRARRVTSPVTLPVVASEVPQPTVGFPAGCEQSQCRNGTMSVVVAQSPVEG